MVSQLRPAFMSFLLLTIITGLIYPFVVTGVAQVIFPGQANGSLIYQNGQAVGSTLIGQPFRRSKIFLGAPFGDLALSGQRSGFFRLQLGPDE